MEGDTDNDLTSSSTEHVMHESVDASISSSVVDLHSLAAFGEIDSLEQALRSRAVTNNTPLATVVNQPDELGLTLLHAAAQSGQQHVSAYPTLT